MISYSPIITLFLTLYLIAQSVKSLTAMQETWVQSLGWEDSLEKEMASHAGILAWRIQWTEEPGRLPSMGSQQSDMTERLSAQKHYLYMAPLCFPLPTSNY